MTGLPLQSSGPGPLVSLIFVAVGIAVLVLFARGSVGRLTTMLRTEQRSVAAVEPGQVEVEGEVLPAEETVSSRTMDTGYADAVVTQYRESGGPNDEGRTFPFPVPQQFAPEVLNEGKAVPFYVEDDTGKILVDPAHADVSLKSDHSEHDNLTDHTRVEAILEPGDTVYVLGEAVPASSYSQEATPRGGVVRSLVRFLKGNFDTTADEVIDNEDDLVVTRTSSSSEFLVSDTGEGRGLLRVGLGAVFWTLSGLLAIGSGVYFFATGII